MGLDQNPLLSSSEFPAFDQIQPQHILPALEEILAENRTGIATLLQSQPEQWRDLVAALEEMDDRLDRMWSPISHLNGVADSPELREAYEQALPLLSAYGTEMGQNPELFAAFAALQGSDQAQEFSAAQREYLLQSLRDFKLAGVDLPEAKKAEYKHISEQLSQLSNQFSRNVLDATEGWTLTVTDPSELEGMPESVLAAAQQEADGQECWGFTLHAPSFIPLMTYCAHRPHREAMYTAYVTRASEQGPNAGQWDNGGLMVQILALRAQKAQLVGFDAYAAYSLASKMADNVADIEAFLLELADKSRTGAERDLAELRERAAQDGIDLQAWDTAYYSEKLRQEKFDFSEEVLRVYFPLPQVLSGLFKVAETLFGIQVKPATAPSTYHPDVQFFLITDQHGALRGHFYLDVYAREGKQGGAWMADAKGRRITAAGVQHPTAFLTCNFPPPVEGQPSLLRHDDVVTLFHEFGHGLHHMLTQVEVAGVAGINGVPWDAVELPSQFMENWCWQREGLDWVSGHVETGEPLPDELLDKMLAAKNFQSGLQMLRQVEFALFDLRIHAQTPPPADAAEIQAVLESVREQVAVMPASEFNRFAHGFSHIFAGGYAAGYYSYKWAEVLSADAFSRFEEEGVMSPDVGRDFLQHILERGGSESPLVLFQRFRGRAPNNEALLRHSGLLD